jgi:hypothetical protein
VQLADQLVSAFVAVGAWGEPIALALDGRPSNAAEDVGFSIA